MHAHTFEQRILTNYSVKSENTIECTFWNAHCTSHCLSIINSLRSLWEPLEITTHLKTCCNLRCGWNFFKKKIDTLKSSNEINFFFEKRIGLGFRFKVSILTTLWEKTRTACSQREMWELPNTGLYNINLTQAQSWCNYQGHWQKWWWVQITQICDSLHSSESRMVARVTRRQASGDPLVNTPGPRWWRQVTHPGPTS
jgi:hypothetical protein